MKSISEPGKPPTFLLGRAPAPSGATCRVLAYNWIAVQNGSQKGTGSEIDNARIDSVRLDAERSNSFKEYFEREGETFN